MITETFKVGLARKEAQSTCLSCTSISITQLDRSMHMGQHVKPTFPLLDVRKKARLCNLVHMAWPQEQLA
jgi:hypothetical protein